MKAIIFDLDDTLIMWKEEYIHIIHKYLNEVGHDISLENCFKISYLVDEFEKLHTRLDKKELLDFINDKTNLNLDMNFINDFIYAFKDCSYSDTDVLETVSYLASKYDLYVITNWFTKAQESRLEKMGILKYFKGVYGADLSYLKPNKKVYTELLDRYKPNECTSIGDSLEKDILVPLSLGMDAIWKTDKDSTEFKTIKEIKELMDIL